MQLNICGGLHYLKGGNKDNVMRIKSDACFIEIIGTKLSAAYIKQNKCDSFGHPYSIRIAAPLFATDYSLAEMFEIQAKLFENLRDSDTSTGEILLNSCLEIASTCQLDLLQSNTPAYLCWTVGHLQVMPYLTVSECERSVRICFYCLLFDCF